MQSGIQVLHVPYKGTPPALTDLLAGNVTFMFANILSVLPHAQSGRLRALAITSAKRSPLVPELPHSRAVFGFLPQSRETLPNSGLAGSVAPASGI